MLKRPSEDELIARWFRPLAVSPSSLGLTDDCARMYAPDGFDIILNVDTLVSNVHFHDSDPWDLVARKVIRVGVSDCIAKGSVPFAYMLSVVLPRSWAEVQMDAFAAGLAYEQEEFSLSLLGGDTSGGPCLVVSATIFGRIPKGIPHPTRSGAKNGDSIYITGTVGDAALGLKVVNNPKLFASVIIESNSLNYLVQRHLLPNPRVGLTEALLTYASASIDVSDGLLLDLKRLCHSSKCSASIDLTSIPLSQPTKLIIGTIPELRESIVTGGDDYEILLTVPPRHTASFEQAAMHANIEVTKIGYITEKIDNIISIYESCSYSSPMRGWRLNDNDQPLGFHHF